MDCTCDTCEWFKGGINFPNGYKRDGIRRAYLEAKERGNPEEILFVRLRLEVENMFAAKCYDSWDYAFTLAYVAKDYAKRISSPTGE